MTTLTSMEGVLYLSAMMTVLIVQLVSAYPYADRKVDPFVALANTLRQQERRERLEEQQPFSPFGQRTPVDSGYYYDYGRNAAAPSDDDLWQLEQIQRQLSRAAVLPYFGRVQRRPEYHLPADDRDVDGLIEVDGPEDPTEWYDTVLDLQQAGYDPIELDQEMAQERPRLLLDTLTQYLTPYEEDAVAAPDQAKRAPSDTTTAISTTSTTTTVSTPVQHTPKEQQPPVERSKDGTLLGQKEFPMMRPATPQRHQWWAGHLDEDDGEPSLEMASRGHLKGKTSGHKSSGVSEDKLIQELDSLKTKKN